MRKLAALIVLTVAAGCGGGDDHVTIYLRARLGPDGPPGQRAAVLTPVERERRERMPATRQAVLEILVGPAPEERARGFLDTLPLSTRLLGVDVEDGTATVALAGREPDFAGAAAIVYSLLELDDVDRVVLSLDGQRCCIRTHDGTPISPLTARDFRGWQGEPCRFRVERRCRG